MRAEDLYHSGAGERIPAFLSEKMGIGREQAEQLHLDMLIYTIGIGMIFSVTTPGIPWEEIFSQQERVYRIFMKNILEEAHER